MAVVLVLEEVEELAEVVMALLKMEQQVLEPLIEAVAVVVEQLVLVQELVQPVDQELL